MTARDVQEVRVPPSTSGPVVTGHPWVYADQIPRMPAGCVVRLIDGAGRLVGWGLADEGPIAVRVFGRGEPPADVGRELQERVRRAIAFRTRLVTGETDACRWVGGAGDGLPGLVVDRYGDVVVLRLYAQAWEPWLDRVVSVIAGQPQARTLLRRWGVQRVDGRQGVEILSGPDPGDEVVVHEHGMRLLVRVKTGQKTGMFLDQREHRRMVGEWSPGRDVVNLFSYHGGFSVAAALAGAAQVTSVDVAPEAIADARENFRLNGLDPDAYRFEVADCFEWAPRGRPDLVIVDPPSLTRGKKARGAARSAYRKLHRRLGPWVGRDGLLATSSCTAQLGMEGWRQAVEEGLEAVGDWSWLHLSRSPPDHPVAVGHDEGWYLKFGLLRRR